MSIIQRTQRWQFSWVAIYGHYFLYNDKLNILKRTSPCNGDEVEKVNEADKQSD